FAKFGRVGEVYIPNKFDKRGCRFGFVKFKDVKGVDALSSRLEDVWIGSYKLRINLARFGRNSSKNPASKGKGNGAPDGVSASTSAGLLAQPE
ncbi:hypothetical protein A2U01_0075368, partial [Trifolium medium]|nr:hypothetical protein [Trifolium medium]